MRKKTSLNTLSRSVLEEIEKDDDQNQSDHLTYKEEGAKPPITAKRRTNRYSKHGPIGYNNNSAHEVLNIMEANLDTTKEEEQLPIEWCG